MGTKFAETKAMKSNLKPLLTLIIIFGFFVGCTYPEDSNKNTIAKFSEVDTLNSFKFPAEDDPHLLNKESIADGVYKLNSIQAEIRYWPTGTTFTFQQSYATAGKIAADDAIYTAVTKAPTRELIIPFYLKFILDFKTDMGVFSFGSAADYWAQISTIGQAKWSAAVVNNAFPSIYQIMSIPTGKTGKYLLSNSSQTNTVFVFKEDDGSITIYLKRLMKAEADYVRLSYKKAI
jgi:hypothetical protein